MAADDSRTAELPVPRRVLGIDPGTIKMGWSVVELRDRSISHVAGGTLRPPRRAALAQRLGVLLGALEGLLDEHEPAAVAVEAAFVGRNPQTALALGQARGLPIAVASRHGLSVHEFPPSVVKRAVSGSGRASKQQVRLMVQQLLQTPERFAEDHADAAAVAVTALRVLHGPAEARERGRRRAALRPPGSPARTSPARDRLLAAIERGQARRRRS